MVKSALLAKMLNSSGCIISKSDAIEIACHAFRSAVMRNPINAVNGFRTTGIYPPSLPSMQARLRLFASGGARGDTGRAVWLKRKAEIQEEIRSSVLQLPPAPYTKGKRARRTVDFVGRLITKEMLLQGEL
ncbi:hypothetical protein DVH05_021012 [Phytophthora capsici]|nr:hypothetical protein DVH05_021012 [Phytophthora capsici]